MICRVYNSFQFRITLLLLIVSLFSCSKGHYCDCFISRGANTSDIRTLPLFNTLKVYGKIDVYFTQDSTLTASKITVVTGSNLVSGISTNVTNGTLEIKNNNKCNFMRGENNEITIYISAPKCTYFVQAGVGNIYTSNTLRQDTVDCTLTNNGDIHIAMNSTIAFTHTHGMGDVYFSGSVSNLFNNTQGQGFVEASNLTIQNYSFFYFGSNGVAHVRCIGRLDVVVASTGNVYYSGNPTQLNPQITGSGALIPE